MKRIFVSLFMIIFGFTLISSGIFLLNGCSFSQSQNVNGGGGNSDNEETENPDDNTDKDDEEIKGDYTFDIDFTVRVIYRSSATDSYWYTSSNVSYFTINWYDSAKSLCDFSGGTWSRYAASGKDLTESKGTVGNLYSFHYKNTGSAPLFYPNRIGYISFYDMDRSTYEHFGRSTSTANSECRSVNYSNFYIYGNGGHSTSCDPDNQKSTTLKGTYNIYYRKLYTISYSLDGGSGQPSSHTAYAGIGYSLTTTVPTKSGYTFGGWKYSGSVYSSGQNVGDSNANASRTYTAVWNPNQYRVDINIMSPGNVQDYVSGTMTTTYSSDGVTYSNISDQARDIIPYNTTVTIKNISPAVGMSVRSVTCNKGSISSSGGTYTYRATMTGVPSGSWDDVITIQMQWASYTLYFNSNGGTSVSSKIVTYNSAYGALTSPTRSGYIFAGWFKEQSFTNRVLPTTTVTTAGNHYLYAKWVANTYAVSFDNNGGTSGTNLSQIRYIKDTLIDGGSANSANHWTELKAFGIDNVNYASSTKGATSKNQNGVNTTPYLLNSVLSSEEWKGEGMSGGGTCFQLVDLGKLVYIDRIVVWHYGYDTRYYSNNKLEVSADGVNWRTIFSTAESGTYLEDKENGHIVDTTANENLFNAWDFKVFYENSYYSLNNAENKVDILTDTHYPTIAFQASVGYNWSLNNGNGGYVIYNPKLPYGTYTLSYTGWSPTLGAGQTSTCIGPVNKNISWIWSSSMYVNSTTAKEYKCTFTVDENFGGFALGWNYGNYSYFQNIVLKCTSQTVKKSTYNETYNYLPTPTRANYSFDGWYKGQVFTSVCTSQRLTDVSYRFNPGNSYSSTVFQIGRMVYFDISYNGTLSSVDINDIIVPSDRYQILNGKRVRGSYYITNSNFINQYSFIDLNFSSLSNNTFVVNAYEVVDFSNLSNRVTNSTKATMTDRHILHAKWSPIYAKLNIQIKTSSDGKTYTNSSTGGTVIVRYNYSVNNFPTSKSVSISTSSVTTLSDVLINNQVTYSGTPKTGYVFLGYSKTNTGASTTATYGSGTFDVNLYFNLSSGNKLKYDSNEKYFYFEDGEYPQSYVGDEMNKTLNSATSSQLTKQYDLTYNNGTSNVNIPVYTYTDGKKYARVQAPKRDEREWVGTGSNYYYINRSYAYLDRITINVWAYKSNWNTSSQEAIISWTNDGGWNMYLNPSVSNGYLGSEIMLEGEGYYRPLKHASLASLSSGYHMFTLTFDGRYIKTYTDGNLVETQDAGSIKKIKAESFGRNIVVSGECGWSSDVPDALHFNGKTKKIEIQNMCLNEKAVMSLYQTNTYDMWFKVEPIRWRVSDYRVESTDYPSGWASYGAYNTNFTAVSDRVLGIGAVSNASMKEGDSFYNTSMRGNVSASNSNINIQYKLSNATTFYDKYGNKGSNIAVNQNLFTGKISSIGGGLFQIGNSYHVYSDYVVADNSFSYFKVQSWDKSGNWSQLAEGSAVGTTYTAQFTKDNNSSYLRVGFNGNKVDGVFEYDITGLKNGIYVFSAKLDTFQTGVGGYGSFTDVKIIRAGADVDSKGETGMKVASFDEINSLYSDTSAKASDMVAFMLGLSTNSKVDYWTRNLGSNLNNGKIITSVGTESSRWLDQVNGVRFSMTFANGQRI